MNTTTPTQIANPAYNHTAKNGPKRFPPTLAGNGSAAPKVSGKPTTAGTMKEPIKVLLVDDHPIVRRGVAACLAKEPNLLVISEAADGQQALERVRQLNPDIVLMD